MQNFPADLCVLSPRARASGNPNAGDRDSLQNVNTTELPDGALCFALNTATLYRLDKTLQLVSGITVTPIAGPGTWVPLTSAETTLVESGEAIMVSGGLVNPSGVGAWVNLAGLGAGAFQGNSGASFTLNGTGGILTYVGISGKWYQISLSGTLAIDPATTIANLEAIVDINGVVLPASSSPHAALVTVNTASSRFLSLSASYFAELNNGDVLTPLVRNNTTEDDVRLTYFQVHAVSVS